MSYLYLGGEAAVETEEAVGVFDLDTCSWAADTRGFLKRAEQEGRVQNAADDLPKSFVVCGDETVILAQPNAAILARRWENK